MAEILKYRTSLDGPWQYVQCLVGPQGEAGYTPVRGTDYWTAADKEAMVNEVLAALESGEEVSY